MDAPQTIHRDEPTNYAGFWLRFSAALIDAVTLFIPLGVVTFVVGLVIRLATVGTTHDPATLIIAILPPVILAVVWFYSAAMESSPWQATIGKKVLRLYVTDVEGRRLAVARAAGRNVAKCLSAVTAGVGYFICGFTQKKQALHDMVADCLVLRQRARRSSVHVTVQSPD
jgi:uncharacterized RDD family membrane protein YckC